MPSPGTSNAAGIRAYGRAPVLLAVLVVTLGAASWFHPDVDGSDLWWHLASGRFIWQHGAIPMADPFSHTARGQPWVDHEWLWGLVFWGVYRIHPDLVAWLNLGVLVATFSTVAFASWRMSGSWLAAGAATWLAAATSSWFLDVRPHLVSLLFVAILLATFRWRRGPFLWPVLMALWANLHAGFVFGLGMIGLHALVRSVTPLWRRRWSDFPKDEWIGLSVAVLATGLNPWGFGIHALPLETLDPSTPFRNLIEWQPPGWSLDPASYAGRFAWLLILTVCGLVPARRDPFLVVLAGVTAVMACSARRFIPLFAITAAPVVAVAVAAGLAAGRRVVPVPRRLLQTPLLALVGLGLAAGLWHGVRFLPHPLQRWTQGEGYPSGAVSYLRAMPNPPKRLFNLFEWGGYVAFRAPGIPVFIDGRAGTVYGDRIAAHYLSALGAEPGWRGLLDRHGIDAALLPVATPLAQALVRDRAHWQTLFVDPRSILLIARSAGAAKNLPALEDALGNSSDLHLALGYQSRRRHDLNGASQHLQTVVRKDPLQIIAYAELMQIAARRDEPNEVQHWIDAALDRYPRRRRQIFTAAEFAWGLLGDRAAQIDALRNSLSSGPFVRQDPEQVRLRIRELEDELGTSPRPEILGP